MLGLLFGTPLLWSVLGSVGITAEASGFTLAHYSEIFNRPTLQRALIRSMYFGIAPVTVTLVLSIALALVLRRHFWGRKLFNGLYKMPIAVPGIIAALVVLTVAERGGFLDRAVAPFGLHLPPLVRDPRGVGVILTTVWKQLPFMTLVIGGAFAAIPEDIVSASRTLGAGRWRTLLHVELPMALPGISAAVLLTFIGSMGAFAIPDLIGAAAPQPLTVHMVAEFGNGNLQLVYAMGMVLSVFAVAVLLGYYHLVGRATQLLSGKAERDDD
ncbi:ABC transporter permease [Variovorax sp. AFSI2.2]|uniref:ABC transporter permease n=1 Tax=Variovorax sp. AFSI2.2 TaxID=3384160 RepID=UPI003EBA28FA